MPKTEYLGMNTGGWAPGIGFVLGSNFGSDANIYDKAVLNSSDLNKMDEWWLTTDSILSEPYVRRMTETMS